MRSSLDEFARNKQNFSFVISLSTFFPVFFFFFLNNDQRGDQKLSNQLKNSECPASRRTYRYERGSPVLEVPRLGIAKMQKVVAREHEPKNEAETRRASGNRYNSRYTFIGERESSRIRAAE